MFGNGYVWKNGSNPDFKNHEVGYDSIGTAVQQVKDVTIPNSDSFFLAGIRQQALWSVLALVNALQTEGDEKEDVTPSELLDAITVEATENYDDEDDDGQYYALYINSVADALRQFGVDEATINDAMGNDTTTADSAIESISETVLANLPDDGEPLDTLTDDFIFGSGDELSDDYDAMANGKHTQKTFNGKKISYVGAVAIRHGKRVIVNKRMPNQKVRLTQGQKKALKKAHIKAFSANAMKRRKKSFMKGAKLGLHNK